MTSQLTVGIDPGKVHIGAICSDDRLVDAGELKLLPDGHLTIGDTELGARGLLVVIEIPDTSTCIYIQNKFVHASVMKTIERATELKVLLVGSGCKVYAVHANPIRRELPPSLGIQPWHSRMKYFDEKKMKNVKYPFDRYWNDQLKGCGIRTGRGTPLNSAHARDAYLYALWGFHFALKQPLIAEKWLAYH